MPPGYFIHFDVASSSRISVAEQLGIYVKKTQQKLRDETRKKVVKCNAEKWLENKKDHENTKTGKPIEPKLRDKQNFTRSRNFVGDPRRQYLKRGKCYLKCEDLILKYAHSRD